VNVRSIAVYQQTQRSSFQFEFEVGSHLVVANYHLYNLSELLHMAAIHYSTEHHPDIIFYCIEYKYQMSLVPCTTKLTGQPQITVSYKTPGIGFIVLYCNIHTFNCVYKHLTHILKIT